MDATRATPAPRRDHPNRLRFTGILTRVEQPSDKAPCGSRGHRVLLDRAAVEEALWSLEGMGVDFKDGYEGHDSKQGCGIIERGYLEGDELHVEGYLFARNHPDLVRDLRRNRRAMGMSYELADAHVQDMRAEVWRLTRVTFTGAAILYADKAAYGTTTFCIAASDEPFTGRISFVENNEATGDLDVQLP